MPEGPSPASHTSRYFRFLLMVKDTLKILTNFSKAFQKGAKLDFRWAFLCWDQECVRQGWGAAVLLVALSVIPDTSFLERSSAEPSTLSRSPPAHQLCPDPNPRKNPAALRAHT